MNGGSDEIRQEHRDKKLRKERERIPKHGKNLAKVYIDAIRKRLKHEQGDKG